MTPNLEDNEIVLLITILEVRANALFQARIEEAKKGKNKNEQYAKSLLEEYNLIENILKKLKQ
jgi:stalled ribosome alternative rescue factor ArfA